MDGGPSYLRFAGADLARVDVLVNPDWPRSVRLDLLQEALRLARQLGCWFEPNEQASDAAVARVVLWLRGCCAAARGTPQTLREALVAAGEWPPAPREGPRPAMVKPLTHSKRAE